jgi:hypothetical protein
MSATDVLTEALIHASDPAQARVAGLLPYRCQVLIGALLLTLAQVVMVSLVGGYRGLHQWDSNWYARIAAEGYPEDLPRERERMAEVGFFPGYPLAVRAVARLTGLPVETATLVAAQLAACGVWAYVLLFLRRDRVPVPLAAASVFLLVAHPSAFFLAAGYSESLFLCATLGFVYWSSAGGPAGWLLAALHGVVMTATRIVGLPLAVVPLLLALVSLVRGERPWGDVIRAGVLGAVACLGGLHFFAFCQWQYGRWDAYMYAQVAGWGVAPDYLALLKSSAYCPRLPLLLPDGALNPNALSQWVVPLTVLLFGGLVLAELRLGRGATSDERGGRIGLLLAAGVTFYIAASGTAFSGFIGLLRYSYCAHVELVLAAAHLLGQVPAVRERPWRELFVLVPAVPSAVIQLMLVWQFTHREWVA